MLYYYTRILAEPVQSLFLTILLTRGLVRNIKTFCLREYPQMALLLRASRCLFLPRQKHEYKRNGHDRRRYHDRLECARVDVDAGKLHKRQREYSKEPESHNNSYEVVVSLQESREPKPIYLFPVAANAFSSVAGHICGNSARRTYSAFTKVAFSLCKPRATNGTALLLLLVSHCATICYYELLNNITLSCVKQNLNLLIWTVGKGSKNSYT